MASWPQIRAGIFAGESGGDYDALFGFSNRPGKPFANIRLSNMTVDDAINFSNPRGPYAQWVKGQVGRVATPMGAYQVVGSTLRAAKDGIGLTGKERMDAATQDRIGQWILANQGTSAWEGYRGPGDPNKYPTGPASNPNERLGGDSMVARNHAAEVAAATNTPIGDYPGIDGAVASIWGGGDAPGGGAQVDPRDLQEQKKSPLQGILGALSQLGDGPSHARMGPMGDARQSGSGLLEYLAQGGNPLAQFARKQRGILG